MKTYKTFLTEGMSTEVSTALETVLGTAWESVANNDDEILKVAMADDPQFKKASKFWNKGSATAQLNNLKILGDNIVKSAAAPSGKEYKFQKAGSISSFWSDNGGSNNTAKADIILGNKQYSVKNADGAQLMSGKKGESSATAAAAAEAMSGGTKDFADDLIESIQKLETVTTKGYYASSDNLQRLKQNASSNTTLYMLASALIKEKERYAKEEKIYKKNKKNLGNISLKKMGKDTLGFKKLIELSKDKNKKKAKDAKKKIENIKATEQLENEWLKAWPPSSSGSSKVNPKDFGDEITRKKKVHRDYLKVPNKKGIYNFAGWNKIGKLGTDGNPTLGRDLPKVYVAGIWPPELTTKLDKLNREFTDRVDTDFADNAKEVNDKLVALFKNPDFKKEFCYEAASGYKKFDNSSQTANSMLSWAPTKGLVQEFKISTYPMKNSKAKIIGLYSDQMKLEVNWKSSSTYKHKGYNVYQNIRLGLGKLMEETNVVQDTLFEDFKELKNSLQEGVINEAGFLSKIKGIAKNFVSSIKELGKRILNWFKEAIDKIKSAASEGIFALGSVLGFEMDVQTNADQEISIPI